MNSALPAPCGPSFGSGSEFAAEFFQGYGSNLAGIEIVNAVSDFLIPGGFNQGGILFGLIQTFQQRSRHLSAFFQAKGAGFLQKFSSFLRRSTILLPRRRLCFCFCSPMRFLATRRR